MAFGLLEGIGALSEPLQRELRALWPKQAGPCLCILSFGAWNMWGFSLFKAHMVDFRRSYGPSSRGRLGVYGQSSSLFVDVKA